MIRSCKPARLSTEASPLGWSRSSEAGSTSNPTRRASVMFRQEVGPGAGAARNRYFESAELRGYQRDHAQRAAAAVHDLEWRRNDDRPRRWQPVEVAEAGQPELAGAVHRRV